MERMIERAKEELEILETHHPHRFDYLKLELNSFISTLLQSHHPLPTTSTATTQASTSMKRKRVFLETEYKKKMKMKMKKRDRVDDVLDKAQACLRKIQELKFTLIS